MILRIIIIVLITQRIKVITLLKKIKISEFMQLFGSVFRAEVKSVR